MQKIKNIIFDYGGVIINIDYQLTINAFKQLGIKNFDVRINQTVQNKLIDNFEIGKITSAEFRSELKKLVPLRIKSREIDDAWNAMLLGIPKRYIKFLEEIKNKYRLFLLSNANKIHINFIDAYLKKTHGIFNLNHLFEKVYYSHEIEMRKPNQEVFMMILKENHLQADETLFIDDTYMHIEGAKKAGLKTFHFKRNVNLINVLKKLEGKELV